MNDFMHMRYISKYHVLAHTYVRPSHIHVSKCSTDVNTSRYSHTNVAYLKCVDKLASRISCGVELLLSQSVSNGFQPHCFVIKGNGEADIMFTELIHIRQGEFSQFVKLK